MLKNQKMLCNKSFKNLLHLESSLLLCFTRMTHHSNNCPLKLNLQICLFTVVKVKFNFMLTPILILTFKLLTVTFFISLTEKQDEKFLSDLQHINR